MDISLIKEGKVDFNGIDQRLGLIFETAIGMKLEPGTRISPSALRDIYVEMLAIKTLVETEKSKRYFSDEEIKKIFAHSQTPKIFDKYIHAIGHRFDEARKEALLELIEVIKSVRK